MIFARHANLNRNLRCLGIALAVSVSAALFAGCKGNTTAAAYPERAVASPPAITAYRAPSDPRTADPLTSDLWQGTHWYTLSAPSNTTRTTAATKAAVLVDAGTLYVAFISQKHPENAITRDAVSLFLDTTGRSDGTELVKISLDHTGKATCLWVRSTQAPEKHEDGSPDLARPVFTYPLSLPTLATRVADATDAGNPVWTSVMAVPLKDLPQPLRMPPAPGAHWKFNLVRNVVTRIPGELGEQLQANLSPVYAGAQELSPDRLADLTLAP